MLYGQRDYWPDGSYITTEWFVVAWVPIIPPCSKRISYTKDSDYAKYDASEGFYVYETLGVDRRQALFIYLWLTCVVGPFIILGLFQDALIKKFGDEDLVGALCSDLLELPSCSRISCDVG